MSWDQLLLGQSRAMDELLHCMLQDMSSRSKTHYSTLQYSLSCSQYTALHAYKANLPLANLDSCTFSPLTSQHILVSHLALQTHHCYRATMNNLCFPLLVVAAFILPSESGFLPMYMTLKIFYVISPYIFV